MIVDQFYFLYKQLMNKVEQLEIQEILNLTVLYQLL